MGPESFSPWVDVPSMSWALGQAPKPRGKSGDAEKCHQVTCISLALARHCPSLPVPHFISHLNSCHLYITIHYEHYVCNSVDSRHLTSLSLSIQSISHDLTAPHETDVSYINSAVICLILFGLWWTHGLMDWWACLFSLSSYGMSLGWGQVGWSLWLADTLLSDWRPGRRFQLWSSPFQTSAVECHLLVSKGVTECEGWER